MASAPACHAGGRGFEAHRSRQVSDTQILLNKGLAFQGILPASFLFTGVDAEVQGAVASNIICGSSSIGGAPAFQAGCCEFESRLPLQRENVTFHA